MAPYPYRRLKNENNFFLWHAIWNRKVQEDEKDSQYSGHMASNFYKALAGIVKSVEEITSGEMAKKNIKGVGDKLSKIIQKDLDKIRNSSYGELTGIYGTYAEFKEKTKPKSKKKGKKRKADPANENDGKASAKKKRKTKPYKPKERTCPWAIMVAFHQQPVDQFLSKERIIDLAQPLTNSSFTEAKNKHGGSYGYTGWACMPSTLVKKHGLIMTATSKIKKYGLTEKGRVVAKQCFEEYDDGLGLDEDIDDDQGARNYSQPSYSSQSTKKKKSSHSQPNFYANSPSGGSSFDNFDDSSDDEDFGVNFGLPPTGYTPPPVKNNKRKNKNSRPSGTGGYRTQNLNQNPSFSLNRNAKIIGSKPNSYLRDGWTLSLVVDNAERRKKKTRDTIFEGLEKLNVPVCWERLSMGDYLFLATKGNQRVVIPLLIERKQVADLAESMIGKRGLEQIHRMKLSGIKCVIYLVEGNLKDSSVKSNHQTETSMKSFIRNTGARDFLIVRTEQVRDTVYYLKELYCSICKYIQEKYTDDNNFDINCILGFCQSYSFKEYQDKKENQKIRADNLKQLFQQMLLGFFGFGAKKVEKITSKYASMASFCKALSNAERSGANITEWLEKELDIKKKSGREKITQCFYKKPRY